MNIGEIFQKVKQNIFIKDTRKLDKGFLKACDAVTETLGAEGKFALLENSNTNSPPIATKDGVSVMQHIRFSNKTENFGALQAIAGAAVTLQKAGDSTTTTASFMQGYLRKLKRKNFNKKVERGIQLGVEEVNNWLEKLAKPTTQEDLKKIIKTSVNNDDKLATVIFNAFNTAGKVGAVEVVKNPDLAYTTFTEQDGMYLDSHGYTSPYFVSRDTKTDYNVENVGVLCAATWESDSKLTQTIKNFYQVNDRKTPLVLFLERPNSDVDEELIKLKHNGCNVCVVAVNGYDEFESETLLNDIALLTGATVYNPRDPKPEFTLGLADKLVVTYNTTTISVFNAPSKLYELIDDLELSDKKDARRLKRLKGKVVIIEVGGLNDLQIKEEFDRVEDAIASVKSSQAEGYISGGGSAIVHISGKLNTEQATKEIQRGYDLVKQVIKEPFIKILDNANRKTKTKWWHWYEDYITSAQKQYGIGYNATTDEISNLFDDGVIDSKKSIRIALESATERAIQMFNIGVIVHFPEEMKL
jgi:chaperonin GroEL